MLRLLDSSASTRKYRLFACACFDMLQDNRWRLELDPKIGLAVDLARRFADAQATDKERTSGLRSANKWTCDLKWFSSAVRSLLAKDAWEAAVWVNRSIATDLASMGYAHEEQETLALANECLTEIVLECFGTLHLRPVAFSPEWRTETVMSLAQQMYDSRDFSAMPILADALQDAGCDNEDILDHCRGGGPHVRGCWVVDACLGKA
jgi:hypothetical protein